MAVSRAYVFEKSWNKTYIPLPFSRQVFYFGKPIYFGQDKDNQALETYCRQVEAALHQAHDKARRILMDW